MFTKLATKVDSQEMWLPIVLVKIQNISVPHIPHLIWHVISRSGVVISITNCYIRFTLLYFTPKTTGENLQLKPMESVSAYFLTTVGIVTKFDQTIKEIEQ